MKKYLLLICLVFLYIQLEAQSFDLEEYNKEKAGVLNVILNSVQFDSVYSSDVVYFENNELWSSGIDSMLYKRNVNIKVINNEEITGKQYVVLGDFTMDREKYKCVRVQLEIMPQKKLLNLRLEKIDGYWQIVNHLIIDEEIED